MRRSSRVVLPAITIAIVLAAAGIAVAAPGQADNLARSGTASASYTSPWESVAAINDGIDPPSSNNTTHPRWGTWPNQGQQWAQLQWGQAQTLRSADVYFFDDGGGVRLPASWKLQIWNGTAYVDVAGASTYPVATNRYNAVNFTAVSTTRLRVLLQSGQASVGLLEVRAYATAIPTGTPTATPTAGPPTTPGVPPSKTVRVLWLKPSDVAYDPRYPDGIANVMREAQRYYRQELGRTFTLNTQVVETVNGDHVRSWYENTPNGGDRYWWSVFNMQQELIRKLGLRNPDTRWLIVGEISAEGPGAGGGASSGWVILSGHDADGAAGVGNTPMNRWYGGMVHELGHAFGLPDSASTDGTPMSASFYNYPNTHFSQVQKNQIMAGAYGGFLA